MLACTTSSIAVAVAIFGTPAWAQPTAPFPTRTVRVVVPFPPGGATDIAARALAERLSEQTTQQFVIDNRPGAGANIGPEIVAKSKADGYTLLVGTVATHAISTALLPKLGYDLRRDLAPISLVANSPHALVCNPALPARNPKELIALVRTRPGQMNFGSSGTGTLTHMELELLRNVGKLELTHVPYKGSPPALFDLFAGQVSCNFDSVAAVINHVRAGKLRPIAVATRDRSGVLPDVPTFAESGFKGLVADNWFALFAPNGTPREIIVRLNAETVKAIASKELAERLKGSGLDLQSSTPERLGEQVATDLALWAKIVKDAGIKAE
ncbi:MAG: tripartite tricarboxylate transporter substrate binding protein [Proteobacteria bacterium]|nr:tripartite tricarboxylate transporter substrate binding protein [Burkholderiales bacterium]